MTVTVATPPVVRALLGEARSKGYPGGVLGIRAQPVWSGDPEFEHDGVPVRVVPCPSALAAREALLDRRPDAWLVILTDRDDGDLGTGITAHLVGQRVRTPDLWQAVRDRFQASRIDHRLVSTKRARELALPLLTAAPADGWPPTPGGLLTPDHAFGSVAVAHLGFAGTPGDIDRRAVLTWVTSADAEARLRALRALAVPALADCVVDWLADRCGAVGEAVGPLLRTGQPGEAVPLGLVARAIRQSTAGSGPRALLRQRFGIRVFDTILEAWADAAEQCTATLLDEGGNTAAAVLARAETLLAEVEAEAYADASDLLRRGLTERLVRLGEALRTATERADVRASVRGPDAPLADPDALPAVEAAWARVDAHRLAKHHDETRVPRGRAAVQLTRWLTADLPEATDLAALTQWHRDADAWADRAFNDAWTGVHEDALARGLHSGLHAVRLRRDAHDSAFARALAAHEEADRKAPAGVHYLEDLLADVVIPLAKHQPTLLVVADGMSVAVATEVVDDIVRRYESWLECVPEDTDRREIALALLPSLTHVSRASLLCGDRTLGDKNREVDGFGRLCKAHGVAGRLFHKQPLETRQGGFALAGDVAAAVDDTTSTPLVACVLNTIDDALDRSDPGGTAWTATTVKHLLALLDRARSAGRVVVLTADHGHVIERRDGQPRTGSAASSNRSRPTAGGAPAGDGEVRVRGRRVLLHDGDAILAVNERLRYGPMKAGYHGGTAPAEVVVPVCVLAPGEPPAGWRLAPPQSPAWWRGPVGPTEPPRVAPPVAPARKPGKRQEPTPTLFDQEPDLVSSVLASSAYQQQRARAQRLPVTDEQVGRLLRALLTAPGGRLDPDSAAAALGIATVQVGMALPAVQRLLNVEQYPVIGRDPDGATIVLDEGLLRDQFGVRH